MTKIEVGCGLTTLSEFYKNALQYSKTGADQEYADLVLKFKTKEFESTSEVFEHLNALRSNVTLLGEQHEALVGHLLSIRWSTYGDRVVALFSDFLTDLISAQTFYAKGCIHSLVRGMAPNVPPAEDDAEERANLQKDFQFYQLLLARITRLVPLSSTYVCEAVARYFPYHTRPIFALENFTINALKIVTHLPNVRLKILSTIVDRMTAIDALIDKSDFEAIESTQFTVEGLIDSRPSNENIEKLDQLMLLMLTFLDSSCRQGGVLIDRAGSAALLAEMLQIFQDTILLTQRSSHVQFLIFYFLSFDQTFAEDFLCKCWSILANASVPALLRQTAVCYLASFLSRARYLEISTVKRELRNLADWCHRYLDVQDGGCADLARHAPFYTTCQALFYVFVFHHESLLADRKGIKFIRRKLNLQRLVTCRLNPLRFCLQTVVELFARITRTHEIVFCYSIMEHNNRTLITHQHSAGYRDNSNSNHADTRTNQLESYFPFDPYQLTRSAPLITPLFRPWLGGGLDSDDEGTGSEDEDCEFEVPSPSPVARFRHDSTASFDMMCVSPGFQMKVNDTESFNPF